MGKKLNLVGGIGLGAVLAFLMDPDGGGRRRALVRDKAVRLWHEAGDLAGRTSRRLRNRVRGMGAETAAAFREEPVSDDVLVARVRSQIGHAVSHPGAIEVTVRSGRVTLGGPVLADEVDDLLARVRAVRGVGEIDNRLDVHVEPGGVPGLQGGPGPGGQQG